jgi:hypothetical protein
MQLSSEKGHRTRAAAQGRGLAARRESEKGRCRVCPPTVHRWLMTLKLDMSVAAFSGFLLEAYGIEENTFTVQQAKQAARGKPTYLPTCPPRPAAEKTYLPTYLPML